LTEARFVRDTNHCVSKRLVAQAQDTARGIAIEDLNGIRERAATVRTRQRRALHSWSFAQLRSFLAYKAVMAGVRLVAVDPRNTSRTCSACGHCDKANRQTQSKFICTSCGYVAHADVNAAVNIGRRAAVIPPHAAPLNL
jgi:IS605 OrfB family transposase